ncbi:MAG: group III truncated hemoglobin [Flavobacteriaceae bacterium]|nr:group III truncated hemoglobin [Flavobacteriaceae bacterium]
MKAITVRKDVKFIITKFYEKLIADAEMLPFFEEIIAKSHLEHHLEVITDFWQDILLDTSSYENNVLQKHLDFNKKMPFGKKHFEKWLYYLIATIDDYYEGEIAERMKASARSIATVMQVKMKLFK